MTNKEAIYKLIQFRRILEKGVFPVGYRFDAEPFDMAIAALEKQEEIKSCTPPSDDWEHYADRLHDIAYQSGYEQGKKDAEQDRWIPVTERLPEENGTYLACYEDVTVLLDWFNGKWFFYRTNPAIEETGTVLAWRPLPEPYKAENTK